MDRFKIIIRQIADQLSDLDDKIDNPAGTYYFEAESENAALDILHSTIPIGCLEEFSIIVQKNNGE